MAMRNLQNKDTKFSHPALKITKLQASSNNGIIPYYFHGTISLHNTGIVKK